MKENGINKLIELLNEYGEIRKYNNVGIVEWVEHTKGNLYWKYWENTWSYMVVISKEYGFIKWLVDNDKINLYMLDSKAHNTDIIIELYKYGNLKDKDSKRLLMLLAIQDEPIRFLCEIIK